MKINRSKSHRPSHTKTTHSLATDITRQASRKIGDTPGVASEPKSEGNSSTGIIWRFERVDVPDYIPAQTMLGNEVHAFRFYLDIRRAEKRPGTLDFGIYWAKDTDMAFWTSPFERPFFPGPMRFHSYDNLVEWVIEVLQCRTGCTKAERAELQHGFESLITSGVTSSSGQPGLE